MHDLITVRCDGCGDTRYDCGRWMTRATHRVLGVFCGRFAEVREDDMDDVAPLPTEDTPRYVAQVEEPQAKYGSGGSRRVSGVTVTCPTCDATGEMRLGRGGGTIVWGEPRRAPVASEVEFNREWGMDICVRCEAVR